MGERSPALDPRLFTSSASPVSMTSVECTGTQIEKDSAHHNELVLLKAQIEALMRNDGARGRPDGARSTGEESVMATMATMATRESSQPKSSSAQSRTRKRPASNLYTEAIGIERESGEEQETRQRERTQKKRKTQKARAEVNSLFDS